MKTTTLVLLLLFTLVASSAVIPRFSLENLVDRSGIIAEGHIVRSWTAWDPDHRYIWTHYELRVSDRIRGGEGPVTVSEPGGSLDGINQGFSGTLPYSAGEHVLLFLYKTPVGYWRTTGGGQGKFDVNASERVAANMQGLEFASHSGEHANGTSLSTVSHMHLSQFKSMVRRMAQTRPVPREGQ